MTVDCVLQPEDVIPGRGNTVNERDSGFRISCCTLCMARVLIVSWSIAFSKSSGYKSKNQNLVLLKEKKLWELLDSCSIKTFKWLSFMLRLRVPKYFFTSASISWNSSANNPSQVELNKKKFPMMNTAMHFSFWTTHELDPSTASLSVRSGNVVSNFPTGSPSFENISPQSAAICWASSWSRACSLALLSSSINSFLWKGLKF